MLVAKLNFVASYSDYLTFSDNISPDAKLITVL
jgi:hypothetical protein